MDVVIPQQPAFERMAGAPVPAEDGASAPSGEPGGRGMRRLQREMLYAVVALVLVTLWGLILWSSTQERRRLLDDSTRELAQLNDAVAQHTAGLLTQARSDLHTLHLWLQTQPAGSTPLDEPHVADLADGMRRAAGGLLELYLVGADGRWVPWPSRETGVVRATPLEIRDDVLPLPGEGTARLNGPVLARGRWVLPMARRLDAPAGLVRGLVAAIDLDRLVALHDRLRLKPEGTIALVRADGIWLSRAPFEPRFAGMDARTTPSFRNEYGARARGAYISSGAITDGVTRVVSFSRLEEHPVIVLVTRGLGPVLRAYDERQRVVFAIAAVLSVLLVGFTLALRRSLRDLHRVKGALRLQARTDDLTGALNRRALFEAGACEFERSRRYDRPLTVLMIDADHFKRVNDRHGHAAGDTVLRRLGGLWQSVLRTQDLLGRIGGEEFCILLPETGPDAAAPVAERLRQITAAHPVVLDDGTGVIVTASIGWAVAQPGDPDWLATLARADHALYRAKAEGRNRVCEAAAPAGAAQAARVSASATCGAAADAA